MHTQNIRISRVTQPRGTLLVMALLAVVFLSFGVVAEACSGDQGDPANADVVHKPASAQATICSRSAGLAIDKVWLEPLSALKSDTVKFRCAGFRLKS